MKKGEPNYLGVASFDQAKSVLVHLFRMRKYDVPVPVDFAEKVKLLIRA